MSIPFIVTATIASISTTAAIANKAGKLNQIDHHKNKVRVLALASIALTAALYKGVTFASVKALGNRAVSFLSGHKLKAGAGTLAAAGAAYYFFSKTSTTPPPADGQ